MRTSLKNKKWKIKSKNYTGSSKNLSSDYTLKCLCNIKLLDSTFNAIINVIKKIFKKKAYFNYKINKSQIITNKSIGMRMGKGKGSKKKKIYLINQGNIFLILIKSNIRTKKDYNLFSKIINRKLPFHLQSEIKKNIFLNM